MTLPFSSADRALAQRTEAADSAITSSLVIHASGFDAERAPGGGWCLFGGAGSPLTHAVGAGMLPPAGAAELDRIEDFYRGRGVGCYIDLCPLAETDFIAAIQSRPYRVIELNNVMLRRIVPGECFPAPPPDLHPVTGAGLAEWGSVVARGFADGAAPTPQTLAMMSVLAPRAHCFLAGGSAGAAMGIDDGVAWMFGDATLPEARGRGLQQALIRERLALAAGHGCELAGAAVLPGSASHRNYERAGFQLIYMRVNVVREFAREARP